MELERGDEIVIARNLGHKNVQNLGDGHDYYYQGAGNLSDIPLRTAGKVASIQGSRVTVELANGKRVPFHIDEIRNNVKKREKESGAGTFNALPEQPAEALARKTPLFVIDERLYWSIPENEANSNIQAFQGFFYKRDKSGEQRQRIVEGMMLRPLQRVYLHNHATKIKKLEEKFLEHLDSIQGEHTPQQPAETRLVSFALTEVFPLFKESVSSKLIDEALGVDSVDIDESKKTPVSSSPSSNPRIEKLLQCIRLEEFDSEVHTRGQRLDELFGETQYSLSAHPRMYSPKSILGSALQGRNVAFVDNKLYVLQRTLDGTTPYRVELAQQPFSFFPVGNASELWEKANFILDKTLRIRTLERAARLGWGLAPEDARIAKLVVQGEYQEGSVGFTLRSRYSPQDIDASRYQGGRTCFIWITIPEHAMRSPNSGEYYKFDSVKAAVPVFLTEQGVISWDNPRVIERRYAHPFVFDNGGICLGNYGYGKLRSMETGVAVARLLADTRRTLLSGYTGSNVNPARSFDALYNQKISLEHLRKLKIPVTNEFLKGKGSGRNS